MDKELFKSLASKVSSQDSVNVLIDVITESDAFSNEEFDNIIALLVGAYNAPIIKESTSSFHTNRTSLLSKHLIRLR